MNDFLIYNKALDFAVVHYKNETRKSSKLPYIIHPLRITTILRAAGFSEFNDEDIFIAALLHDLVEDTDTTPEEIEKEFGSIVKNIVLEVSKPNNLSKDEWLKGFSHASKEAKIIKMADRVDNLLDMEGGFWNTDKKRSYAVQAKIILETCEDANSQLASYLEKIIERMLE